MTRRLPWWAIALVLLAALPPLLASYPQMTDYPAHLAAWHVWLDGGHNPALAAYYRVDWRWMPNLGSELLVGALAPLIGLEAAGRLLTIAIPALYALSLVLTEWALRRRVGIGALLALATVWSPALLMGFLNFVLATALAFLAFALWVWSEGKTWRPFAFLAIAPAVWLCHLSGWGILGVMVFGHEWQKRGLVKAIPATWPLWPPLLLSILSGSASAGITAYGTGVLADKISNWAMGLRDQNQLIDMATVLLLVILALIAWRKGKADGRIGRAAQIFVALSFIMPRFLGGGDFADYRLVPVALACAALAVDWEVPGRFLAYSALPFLIRLGATTIAWQQGSDRTAQMLEALDHLPRGATVAGAYAEAPFAWAQPPFGHVFAYATVRRDALTNSDFALAGVHMLRHADVDPAFADPSQRVLVQQGEAADLSRFSSAAKAQYLWFVGAVPPRALPPGATQVFANHETILLSLAKVPVTR